MDHGFSCEVLMLKHRVPDQFVSFAGLDRLLKELCRGPALVFLRKVVSDVIEQHDALINSADRTPEAVLDRFGEPRKQAVRRECVSRMTSEPWTLSILYFRKHSGAFGTGERRQIAPLHYSGI